MQEERVVRCYLSANSLRVIGGITSLCPVEYFDVGPDVTIGYLEKAKEAFLRGTGVVHRIVNRSAPFCLRTVNSATRRVVRSTRGVHRRVGKGAVVGVPTYPRNFGTVHLLGRRSVLYSYATVCSFGRTVLTTRTNTCYITICMDHISGSNKSKVRMMEGVGRTFIVRKVTYGISTTSLGRMGCLRGTTLTKTSGIAMALSLLRGVTVRPLARGALSAFGTS